MTQLTPHTPQQCCLILFTRYPEPGIVKTRLISALGAEGAANLQRQMTERTLRQIEAMQNNFPVLLEIHFAGDRKELMQAWLGENFAYYQQQGTNLGERMLSAFAGAFIKKMSRVVLIGTDCPALDAVILTQAFQLLERSEVVLGPAADGGYYLIGLSRLIPELFSNISWGTEKVLIETQQIVQSLNLQVSYLPILHDIDVPEDLVNLINISGEINRCITETSSVNFGKDSWCL